MLNGFASYRIEAQDYTPELTGRLTRFYREALNALTGNASALDLEALAMLEKDSPRVFSSGVYRFRLSQ